MNSDSETQALTDAEWGRMWREDSSLERWFPITAEKIDVLKAENQRLREALDKIAGTHLSSAQSLSEIARDALAANKP